MKTIRDGGKSAIVADLPRRGRMLTSNSSCSSAAGVRNFCSIRLKLLQEPAAAIQHHPNNDDGKPVMGIRPSSQLSCSLLACVFLIGCGLESDSGGTATTPEQSEPTDSVVAVAGTGIADESGILAPGSPAPAIAVSKWMQGEPVESFEPGNVYVVEFWATWCGPCLQSMPHMSQLQADYGDKVAFMGFTTQDEATIAPFLASPGADGKLWSEILGYRIALDDNEATYGKYMDAARQTGIPNAFIVGKTGNVEWLGHPMDMDEPLAKIVDGTWDWTAAREIFLTEAKTAEVMQEGMPRLSAAAGAGDFAGALEICDELEKKLPGNKDIIQIRLTLLLQGKMFDELNKTAAAEVEANSDNISVLENISWLLATGSKGGELDLDLSLKAGLQAVELADGESPSVLDTVAAVYAAREELVEAVAWQKKAVALAPESQQLAASLSKYEGMLKAAQEAAAPKTEEAAPAGETPADDTAEEAAEEAAAAMAEAAAAKDAAAVEAAKAAAEEAAAAAAEKAKEAVEAAQE